MSPHVVVAGGGVSGLAAAHRLRRLLGARARITVVDQARQLGGKLRTESLAGVPYDVGAEAFLVRRPEAVALLGELGLEAGLVHAARVGAQVRFDGRLAPLPPRTLLGVPASADGLAGVLSPSGVAAVRAEPSMPMHWSPASDAAVGPLVTQRLGPEVAARLVDPLLGGVYAGRADALGLRPTMPQLAAALDAAVARGGPPSLVAAAASVLPPAATGEPLFGVLRGGMSVLVDALAAAAQVERRLGLPVRALTRTPAGWRLEVGPAPAPEWLEADAVVLAVPPPALRRLLAPLHPHAAAAAGAIEVASSAIVSLALPPGTPLPASSGVLVAAGEPLHVKAVTYSSAKWPHLADPAGPVLVRASIGRIDEVHTLQADDAELVRRVREDLAALAGITAEPLDTLVTRWGGALPQYAVDHLDRVAAIEAGVASLPALAVAGATLRGVGIPACIAAADAAATRIAAALTGAPRV